jgi:dolichol-phosphate mannosyltransferase
LRAADGHRVLIVDDGSPDGTGAIADRLAAELPDELEVLHRPAKSGLGRAYLAGFRRALEAGAAFVCEMDADFSHDPADLARLLDATQDADLVLGSRYVPGGRVEGWGLLRRVVSRWGVRPARLGVPCATSRRARTAEVARGLRQEPVRIAAHRLFQIEMNVRAGRKCFAIREIPIVFRDREVGTSKMSPRIALEAVWRVPQMRFHAR